MTDGIFKLKVHIISFMTDDYLKHNINKGDKVELIGVIQTGNICISSKVNEI